MKKIIHLCFVSCTTLVLVGIAFSVTAHKDATGIVKERMDAMSDMGDAMKVVGDMFKGKSDYDTAVIGKSASTLIAHSKDIASFFPDTKESRTGSKTDALPVLWEQWDRFVELAQQLETEASELERQVILGTEMRVLRKQFAKTVKSCSSCHDDYRRPKE